MFQALGFVVNLVPFHAKDFAEHAFDQVMALGKLAGDFSAGRGQANVAVGVDAHEAVFFQAAQGHGDGRRRDLKPVGEGRRNDVFAFAFGFQDGLEVILFGDGDHVSELYGGGLRATLELLPRRHRDTEKTKDLEILDLFRELRGGADY